MSKKILKEEVSDLSLLSEPERIKLMNELADDYSLGPVEQRPDKVRTERTYVIVSLIKNALRIVAGIYLMRFDVATAGA